MFYFLVFAGSCFGVLLGAVVLTNTDSGKALVKGVVEAILRRLA